MNISIAKTAGFCFGVENAVKMAFETAKKFDEEIYTLGELIHNPTVIESLNKSGIKVIYNIDDIKNNSVVLIRAHGVSKKTYEDLESKNCKIIDATCPYVKKIHELVFKKYKEGYKILIIGDKNHSEVKGINGWCNNSAEIIDCIDLIKKINYDIKDNILIVSQTTFRKEKWEKIILNIKKKYINAKEFDTICNATEMRQKEAARLANENDIILVLGGKNSSNTEKLYQICKEYCKDSYKIETVDELPKLLNKKNKNKKIGITAGASTPKSVIEEVFFKMSDGTTNEMEMNFDEAIEKTLVRISERSIVKGKVIGKTDSEVFVDLGYKADGVIPSDDFENQETFENLKEGDELEVYIAKVSDSDGNVLLSISKVESIRNLDKIEKAYKAKKPINVLVKRKVKGGLIARYKGIDVFVPASQISDRFVKNLDPYIGKDLEILLTEFNPRRKRIIGSARVLIEERKANLEKEFWENIEEGKEYEGTVKSFVDFGAFVDLGAIDGLIHISELSWSMINHPSEVLELGQKVNVFVLNYDMERKRVSLGYKREEDNPWNNIEEKYPIGTEVEVKVLRLLPFGAFVELESGIEGLVHISQISHKRIGHPGEILKIDDVIKAKVTELNTEDRKIALSIKALIPMEEEIKEEESKEEKPKKEISKPKVQEKPKKQKPVAKKKKSIKKPDMKKDNSQDHIEEMNVSLGDILDFD